MPSLTSSLGHIIRAAAPTCRYPFYSDISKSNLQAVGSMHAWPVLLAMLTWLVELIVV